MVVFSPPVNQIMKGRIQCPNCSKQFVVEAKTGEKDIFVSCPFCTHTFHVKPTAKSQEKCDKDNDIEECTWEEYGEPRKTILSSMKPRTDKPMIASILLLIVVCIGIIASITPGLFLQTPVIIGSSVGVQGSISIELDEASQALITNSVNLTIQGDNSVYQGELKNGSLYFDHLPLGMHTASLTIDSVSPANDSHFELIVLPFLSNTYSMELANQNTYNILVPNLAWCSGILIILSVVCLIGALSAWKRMYSDIALIGSIVGILTLGFFLVNIVLSIVALYLIYKSRDEFNDGKKGKSF
jgi:predicted Zn finger-like uncharacterized protein